VKNNAKNIYLSGLLLALLTQTQSVCAQGAPSQYVNMQGINLTPLGIPVITTPLFQLFGGPNSNTNLSGTASFKNFDKVALMGGSSNIRALPTSGTLTLGDFYNSGNWTQSGAITIPSGCRIFNYGTMTFNAAFTVGTSVSGGLISGAGSTSTTTTGGSGGGLGGAPSTFPGGSSVLQGGSGGGHGGIGGASGGDTAGHYTPGGCSYPVTMSLEGSGGSAGNTFSNTAAATNGGAGGGSLYIESTGSVSFVSGTALTLTGAQGVDSSTAYGATGGGGSGGGLDVRSLGQVLIYSGASVTAAGGRGGNSTNVTDSAAGGGGAGGIIMMSGNALTNNGTCSAVGGAAGTQGVTGQPPAAGGTGTVILNSFVMGPRGN
jgi:hypothetical protein